MARPKLDADYLQLRTQLVAAREASGITQADLSTRLGRTQSFVSKYEQGERKLDVMDFVLICRTLHLDPGQVLASLPG